MAELREAFAQAIKESPYSDLEMSWNLECDMPRLNGILNGTIQPSEHEILFMTRFVVKITKKIPAKLLLRKDGKHFEIRITEVNPLNGTFQITPQRHGQKILGRSFSHPPTFSSMKGILANMRRRIFPKKRK